jgi:hypothetical protein
MNPSQIYQQLWTEAMAAFERGSPQIDPNLSGNAKDARRGVTLVLRPSPAVRAKVENVLAGLVRVAPGQHFYRPEEFHVTVLSVISGTEFWRKEIHQLAACRAVISEVLSCQRPFKISFRGVTASSEAVIIQGFPRDDALGKLRD